MSQKPEKSKKSQNNNFEEEQLQKILQEDTNTGKTKNPQAKQEDVDKILAEQSDEEEKELVEKLLKKESVKRKSTIVEEQISDPLLLIDLQEKEQVLKSQKELITTLDDKRHYATSKLPILGYDEVNSEKIIELKGAVGTLTAMTYYGSNVFIGTATGIIVMFTIVMKLKNEDLGMVTSMVVHPEGTLLASGYNNGTIVIWEIKSGNCEKIAKKIHQSALIAIKF